MKTLAASLLSLAVMVPSLALADNLQVYKWTDTHGVIHYSDRAPAAAVAAETLDLPALPPQDLAGIAARQALLVSQVTAMQRANEAEAQRRQAAELARRQADLQAQLDALRAAQQSDSSPAVPLVVTASPFVPDIYRRNLYRFHRQPGHRSGDRGNRPP